MYFFISSYIPKYPYVTPRRNVYCPYFIQFPHIRFLHLYQNDYSRLQFLFYFFYFSDIYKLKQTKVLSHDKTGFILSGFVLFAGFLNSHFFSRQEFSSRFVQVTHMH